MENNKNDAQIKAVKDALIKHMEKPESGELPDDALDGVAGGAVLDSNFFIAKCNKCGWQSCPFDNKGTYDLQVVALDHCDTNPNCEGDFTVFNIDSRNVRFG